MTKQDLKRVLDWEQQITRQCIADLLAAGYELTVNNGGDTNEIPWTKDAGLVLKTMFETDEETIGVRQPNQTAGLIHWVFFVHGNDGYDVINDYSSSLEQVLTNMNVLVEKLNKEWEEL